MKYYYYDQMKYFFINLFPTAVVVNMSTRRTPVDLLDILDNFSGMGLENKAKVAMLK